MEKCQCMVDDLARGMKVMVRLTEIACYREVSVHGRWPGQRGWKWRCDSVCLLPRWRCACWRRRRWTRVTWWNCSARGLSQRNPPMRSLLREQVRGHLMTTWVVGGVGGDLCGCRNCKEIRLWGFCGGTGKHVEGLCAGWVQVRSI